MSNITWTDIFSWFAAANGYRQGGFRGRPIDSQRHFMLYSNKFYLVIESMYISILYILYMATGIEYVYTVTNIGPSLAKSQSFLCLTALLVWKHVVEYPGESKL